MIIFEAWTEGFDRAVEEFREWADKFADPSTRVFIHSMADQIVLTKPTLEMLKEVRDGKVTQGDQA